MAMTTPSPSLLDVDWSKLPVPVDGGETDHLGGLAMPDVALSATSGGSVSLAALSGRTVVYAYPMTGNPNAALPDGWNDIPGARGCSPQSCAFRDHYAALKNAGADHVFGLSTQPTLDQMEAVTRLHLPFALLSDAPLELTTALGLPTFRVDGRTLLRRFTLIVDDGAISHVFYPVFPPDRNAGDVLDWLAAHPRAA